jgi:hypothetical protein
VECYEAILARIEAVHGRKKPSLVENEVKLEEAVDRIPVNQYNSRRAELDAFFKSLGPPVSGSEESLHVSKPGVTREPVELVAGAARSLSCQLIMPVTSSTSSMEGKFVHVRRHPANGLCEVVAGFSRVFLENQMPCIRVMVINSKLDPVKIQRNFDLAMVRWKR